MSADSLYLRAVVQTFKNDAALVKSIKKQARLSPTDQRTLMSELSQMRGTAGSIAHVTGLTLAGHGLATVVAILPGGRAGIGVAITTEEPDSRESMLARCQSESADLPPGFAMLVIPAGVVAGGLQ